MTSELKPNDIWDDATNAVCQAMQENKMCNCPDGDCLAAKIEPSEQDKKSWSATPSADTLAGLKRYGQVMTRIMKVDNGEYVLYSEAAAVVAAKDAEIEKLKDGGHESFKSAVGWQERAKAAEAELAQIKAQEPVTNYIVSDFCAGFDKVKMMPNGRYPLYAAPVDQTAEIDRLREALKFISNSNMTNPSDYKQVACSALSGKDQS